jgi:hypothetical protein
LAKHNIKELSIQVNLNGLSFCILNRSSNSIEYLNFLEFENKLGPFDLLNRLKTELSSNSVFSDEFDDVLVIHQNELATLVPQKLYDANYKADYLKFNSKILKTDFITHDKIAVNESVVVYVPYVNINNYIFDTFGEFVFKHSLTVFVDTVLQKHKSNQGPIVCINVNHHSIELIVLDGNDIQLINSFECHSLEDFIYYVLFVFEQLELDVETTPVKVSGRIDKADKYFEVLYRYIRDVDFLDLGLNFQFADSIDESQLSRYFLILNSF